MGFRKIATKTFVAQNLGYTPDFTIYLRDFPYCGCLILQCGRGSTNSRRKKFNGYTEVKMNSMYPQSPTVDGTDTESG